MTDSIISIRLPSSMVQELKSLGEKNHFVDLSEYIRAILRNECEHNNEPKKASIDLEKPVFNEKKQKLLDELEKIIGELKKE